MTYTLWFDDDPKRNIEDKIMRGAERFSTKRGTWPTVVYGNPATVPDTLTSIAVAGSIIAVKQTMKVQPHHFWFATEKGR